MRDFLKADPTNPGSLSDSEKAALANMQQTNYLADIAKYLHRQNPDVLATAVVKGASQVSNGIQDSNSHEVVFEVGGKPVPIYSLLIYSTWTGTLSVSVLSLSKLNDGIPFIAGDAFTLQVPTNSIFVIAPTATIAAPLIVNGPASPTLGGLFLYGYTISDFDNR